MKTEYRNLLIVGCLCAVTLLLSGCFLRSLVGNVAGEEGEFTASVSATSITANCNISSLPGREGEVTCFYVIEWDPSFELESTVVLIAEFGLFGVLVDPLILQVPESAINFRGISQSGPTPEDLVITVVDAFDVQPGTQVQAEPGQKFAIVEFAEDVLPSIPDGSPEMGQEFDFELQFEVAEPAPVTVKGMFAGKVETGGQTYYVPLFPCVTDFSLVPAIEIAAEQFPQFLIAQIADAINAGEDMTCNDVTYDFSGAVTSQFVYLPLIQR